MFQVSFGIDSSDWLLKTQINQLANRGSLDESRLSHTQTLSHNSQWEPSMLRNPHVVTEQPSLVDQVLDERTVAAIGMLSPRLNASETGFATSVEKAFVNLQFNDLSMSAHAGNSFLSRLSRSGNVLSAFPELSHTRVKGALYETPQVASRR